jgi:putative nucleotidyltransferase-like protein
MEDLLEALLSAEPQARQAWDRWRVSTDVDTLPYACQELFPALSPAFPVWLKHDPAAGIFQGIVRMAWSKNQLRLRKAVELTALLQQAGVRSAVAGPLAWSLRTAGPAFRPIPYITLLVARGDVRHAAEVLVQANWEAYTDVPSGRAMDSVDRVCFHRDGLLLNLQWRLLATPPQDARDCEGFFLKDLCPLAWNGQVFETTCQETTLLHILGDRRDGDAVPWQADVALVGTSGIHWARFRRLAIRFYPEALDRLQELRASSRLPIPSLLEGQAGFVHQKFRYFWGQYRIAGYHRNQTVNWLGFVRFLRERCNLPNVWLVPFAGVRRILEHRRDRAR